jgi:isoleucyl-tRNA synthetase
MNHQAPDPATDFPRVAPRVNLPEIENQVLELWDETDAFALSVSMRPADSEYTFYDGPPFANGSPHYGHLLQAAIKDIVPRYWTMRGHRVERRFGWDTHGLPVEMEVEKDLGVSGPRQIQEFGVDRFNEACRALVEHTTEDWERITRRIGRWVDFENDYKTMDVDFMESVWWVFKTLWDKGLIYQAFKVLPYSFGAATPLSNFEANMDYRDVEDPSITVALAITEDHGPARAGDELLIWTTTPWTLPGNLAIAAGEDISYARVAADLDGRAGTYWLAEPLVEPIFGPDVEVERVAPGSELLGASYEPPFDYFGEERDRGAFRVIPSDDVTTSEGTGLVHMAPAYGEADFYALQAAGINVLVDPVDARGEFTEAVPEVAGQNVKEADVVLVRLLRDRGVLVRSERLMHSYPFCWRTGTPLIYKAIPTWFVAVETFRDRMAELNEEIHWVPTAVGEKRFGNWLRGARDWAISRNRYWGSCLPIWECNNCDERICLGSRAELEDRSGVWLEDLHKHIVDEVTFACQACSGTMTRVPEVLDCWFESGSMPVSQIHYPFENEDRFERGFPANFIAEGLDQTRGWFYTLVVLASAIFDQPPFQNCIVTGHVLAEDGRKMSKSLKNYPDPLQLLEVHGADALRAYLINSPVVRADNLRFSEDGVRDVVRTVLLPFWNAFSFFTTYAEADGITAKDLAAAPPVEERAEIDRWIVSVLQSLIRDVNTEMEEYRLYAVIPPILGFIDDLTNWYIRRSRRRFWRARETGTEDDKLAAFSTLYEVLVTFIKVAAPVIPFITEEMYQRLVRPVAGDDAPVSVHHVDYPTARVSSIDAELEVAMGLVRHVVNLGRGLRKTHNLRVRQPLATMTVVARDQAAADAIATHADLIAEELNVRTVIVDDDESHLVHLAAKANFARIGPRFGSQTGTVAAAIAGLDHEAVDRLLSGESVDVAGESILADDVVVSREPREGTIVAAEARLTVALDTTIDHDLAIEGIARELINRVQGLRREADLAMTDRITLRWQSEDELVAEAFATLEDLIATEVLAVAIYQDADAAALTNVNGKELRLSVEIARAD